MSPSCPEPYRGMKTVPDGSPLPKNITFVLTEECNFRCTYCYLIHKNSRNVMPFEVAKRAIDYILTHPEIFAEKSVNWDFIGGEPLLEIDLMEKIVEYIKLRTYELDHPWFTRSSFGATTNGALYGTPKVQRFIEKYRQTVGFSITVDGPRHVHDLARIGRDGKGTYEKVVANLPLWQAQYPNTATKVTVAHENLPYLSESILHIFDLGIKEIHANVVFENVWDPEDDAHLEAELDKLADGMIGGGLFRDHTCSFFNRSIGAPMNPETDNGNWCGAGKMLAIDAKGRFYPCNRFLAFSLKNKPPRIVGDIHRGIDLNKVRPFLTLNRSSQSPKACMTCEVATGCAWCQGLNYDDAATPTIFQRAVHICSMHKARVRANKRFWKRVDALEAGKQT
jgi:uncharacterized protein